MTKYNLIAVQEALCLLPSGNTMSEEDSVQYNFITMREVPDLDKWDATEDEIATHVCDIFNIIAHPTFCAITFSLVSPQYLVHTLVGVPLYYRCNRAVREGISPGNRYVHLGLAACLVRSIVFGYVGVQGLHVSTQHREIHKLTEILTMEGQGTVFQDVVVPLVRYFVCFLDPHQVLGEEDLLNVDIPQFEQQIVAVRTDRDMLPYSTLASKLIPGFSTES